ncbi:4-coumarate-CoA ligase [Colletotrichum higginsianum]|nr:4-coumarate-CoA ligase [Colletotrichum higginsianum]
MFLAELEELDRSTLSVTTLRTGIISGSAVPSTLMQTLRERMKIEDLLIAYGMTETSPVTFITAVEDSRGKKATSIGRVLPHSAAKVVDSLGNILPQGSRGELCTSGFALQKGYWKDTEKTKEAMRQDENGVTWMHTGDEGFIDEEGYGHITGRIKDLIIRGKS